METNFVRVSALRKSERQLRAVWPEAAGLWPDLRHDERVRATKPGFRVSAGAARRAAISAGAPCRGPPRSALGRAPRASRKGVYFARCEAMDDDK